MKGGSLAPEFTQRARVAPGLPGPASFVLQLDVRESLEGRRQLLC